MGLSDRCAYCTALHYSRQGVKVDYLVLVGAPINTSLLKAVNFDPNIQKMIVIDLADHGDPIYAGMSDIELIEAVRTLAEQMMSGTGEGHFHYAVESGEGATRRMVLARSLYQRGLR